MSLRNYTIKRLDDAARELLQTASARIDSRNHEECHLCQGYSHGAWTCSRCRYSCTHPILVAGYIFRADGSPMAWSRCFACGRLVKGLPRGSEIYDVLLRDNTTTRCERCGRVGSQSHHWAPQAIFADANDWPLAWLCARCHRTWHDAMRRAGGVSLADKVRAEVSA